MTALLFVSFALCMGYAAYVKIRFGVSSISGSFYCLEKMRKGLGNVFWAWAVLTAFTLLPCWMEAGGDGYRFLAFLSAVSLVAVGCFPDYRNEHLLLHPLFTSICGGMSMLWGICAGEWYIPAGLIVSALTVCLCLNRKDLLYWVEVAAFTGMYAAVLFNF